MHTNTIEQEKVKRSPYETSRKSWDIPSMMLEVNAEPKQTS